MALSKFLGSSLQFLARGRDPEIYMEGKEEEKKEGGMEELRHSPESTLSALWGGLAHGPGRPLELALPP